MTVVVRALSVAKREAILTAAQAVYRDEGVQAASMDRISERAKVSKRTVYNHFKSKEGLFWAVVERFLAELAEDIEAQPLEDGPLEGQLAAILERQTEALLREEPLALLRALVIEVVQLPESDKSFFEQTRLAESGATVALIRKAAALGTLRVPDPLLAEAMLRGMVQESLFWPMLLGLRPIPAAEERRRVIREAVDVFLSRYGTTPDGVRQPGTKKEG